MKKLLYILLPLLLVGLAAHSQTVTISPRNFTALDEITITVDVTGNSNLENLTTDAYLWLWVPGGPGAPSNVSPASSNPDATNQAKFTKVEGEENLYTITLVPSTFIGAAPSQITQLGVILKGNDWSNGQTPDFLFDVDPLEFVDRVNRTFPDDFLPQDVVTVFFNQALADAGPIQDIEEVFINITATGVDESGTEVTGIELKEAFADNLRMKWEVAQIYSWSLMPSFYFEVPVGVTLTAINYSFTNADGSISTPTFTDEFLTQE